jgi:hypothetical protein
LRYPEREAWKKTPYQIITLFRYHKEYNPQQFANSRNTPRTEQLDDIDIALGGM